MSSPGFSDSDDGFAAAVRHESPQKISAAPHCVPNLPPSDGPADGDDSSDDRDDDGFEFAFVIKDPEAGPAITADEIFSNGQIRPVYPVFNRAFLLAETAEPREEKGTAPVLRGTLRRLLIEDREENSGSGSSSSSSLGPDELEGVPPGTYCVWAPRSSPVSQAGCKKSSSTGSSLRWRLRDLAVGRSHSDGKEKFVFLAAAQKKKGKGETTATAAAAKEASKEEGDKSRAKGKARKNANEPAAAAARQIYYGSGRPAAGGVAPRRTFLPYKPDLVGFFANVNGLKRTHQPF